MSVLPDSSVWVSYLKLGTRGPAAALDALLQQHKAIVCGPVAAELLIGTPSAGRAHLWALLAGLPWIELGRAEWRRVGEVGAVLRQQGTPVPLTDLEIAVAAAAASAGLWSDDAHFARIAAVMPDLVRFRPSP